MFSVDNFYNYLNQYSRANKLDLDIHPFAVHGSREFFDIAFPFGDDMPEYPTNLIGTAAVFDQEPIQLEYFSKWKDYDTNYFEKYTFKEYSDNKEYYQVLTEEEFIFKHFSRVYNPILMHSERNSAEVELFEKNHFHPVHYFYHGLIARDWFRHWKHYSMERGQRASRLGLYCRDASGSRKYRIELLNSLLEFKDNIYYKLQEPMLNADPTLNEVWDTSELEYDSHSSAVIEPKDCQNFDIQIVPETIFNTTKTHLTEKVFKPMVMKQPFIIVGPPNSLAYLKDYGFRTFDGLWDESYDKELDPKIRMDKITELVQWLSELPAESYNRIMDRAQLIIEHNHSLFFSEAFENTMLTELHLNLKDAITKRNEEYYTMPGGTYFYYLDQLYKRNNKELSSIFLWRSTLIIEYLKDNDPDSASIILEKYHHLFTEKFLNRINNVNSSPSPSTDAGH